jgi:hypothetical protein
MSQPFETALYIPSLSHPQISLRKSLYNQPTPLSRDSEWRQSPDCAPFRAQVEWELACLDSCDIIAMYIDPATKAPITLLEFGLHARSGKLVVCCTEEFWKWGNVQVTSEYYGVEKVPSLDKLAERVRTRVESK